MNVTRAHEAPLKANPHGIEARQVVLSPGAVLMHLTIQAVQSRAGMLHAVRNTGGAPSSLLMVKTPPRG